ncbi:MAG: extracellular solute-binding protein [Alphaproteobacteria bacterium]|nr:extracellular solute-binding protein [Alphaproteobacteria bacterium]
MIDLLPFPYSNAVAKRQAFLIGLSLLLPLSGCDGDPADAPAGTVVVYCSVDIGFAEPILDDFARETGIKVHRQFDTEAGKTTGLLHKLLAERRNPRADVWWSSEVFGTMQLAAEGVLDAYRPTTADDVPRQYRDPDGRWTAFGLRGRVLAYDPKRTRAEDLPRRWCDLVDPKYKGRVAMADPRFGTTRGHMATLLLLWGEPELTRFYKGLNENGFRRSDGNSHSVLMLVRGVVDFAATDTDDVIVAQQRGDSVAMVYPDLDAPGGKRPLAGTLWIPCSVALVKGAPHGAAARKLIDYLASAGIEERLYASDSRNVPVRPGLRKTLDASAPGESDVDYAAAATMLDRSDRLVTDVLLK